jgi:peroxiredoxin 2/4
MQIKNSTGERHMKKQLFTTCLAAAALGIMIGVNPSAGAEELRIPGNMPAQCEHCSLAGQLATTVRVGQPAPDFSLEAVVGITAGKEFQQISLQAFRGKWLVLFFYPADFTFICPTEIRGFNESLNSFRNLNAEILGVSTDSKWSHLAWLKRGDLGDLKYPLLADFNKVTARKYNVLDFQTGAALRGLFIIDPKGVLQYQVVHNADVGRSVDETLRVLEALQSGGLCPLGWKPGQKTLN